MCYKTKTSPSPPTPLGGWQIFSQWINANVKITTSCAKRVKCNDDNGRFTLGVLVCKLLSLSPIDSFTISEPVFSPFVLSPTQSFEAWISYISNHALCVILTQEEWNGWASNPTWPVFDGSIDVKYFLLLNSFVPCKTFYHLNSREKSAVGRKLTPSSYLSIQTSCRFSCRRALITKCKILIVVYGRFF